MRLFRLLKPWRCHPSTQDRWWPGGKKEPIIPDLGDLSAFHSRASQPAFYSDFNRRKKAVGGGPRFREIRGRLDWPLVLWMALKRPVYHLHRQIFSLHLRSARGNLTSRTFLILTFPFLRPRARDRDVSCRVVACRGVAWCGVRWHACFRASPAATSRAEFLSRILIPLRFKDGEKKWNLYIIREQRTFLYSSTCPYFSKGLILEILLPILRINLFARMVSRERYLRTTLIFSSICASVCIYLHLFKISHPP